MLSLQSFVVARQTLPLKLELQACSEIDFATKAEPPMIGYITIGVDDIALARRFYTAFLPRLGYALDVSPEGLGFSVPETEEQGDAPPDSTSEHPTTGTPPPPGTARWWRFGSRRKPWSKNCMPRPWPPVDGTRGRPGFAPNTARTSRSGIYAIRKATRSRCIATTRTLQADRTRADRRSYSSAFAPSSRRAFFNRDSRIAI